jgi:hypothetical protein
MEGPVPFFLGKGPRCSTRMRREGLRAIAKLPELLDR